MFLVLCFMHRDMEALVNEPRRIKSTGHILPCMGGFEEKAPGDPAMKEANIGQRTWTEPESDEPQ